MINQEVSNITQHTGTEQQIEIVAHGIDLTGGQTYCVICGFFLILAFLISLIFKVINNKVVRSCSACKRLLACEQDIKHLKANQVLNKIVDVDILKDISQQVEDLKDKVIKDGELS